MFKNILDDIAKFIMQHNEYFNVGFSDVILSEATGYVATDKTPVFPADNLGTYFYLRLPKNIQFRYSNDYKYSNCQDGIASLTDVILVAIAKGGNSDILIENLIATLRSYRTSPVQLVSAIHQAEYVVAQELANIEETERGAALQRLPKNCAFVSIRFNIIEPIVSPNLKCITDPCTC